MDTLSGHLVGSQRNGKVEEEPDLIIRRRAAKRGDEAARECEMLWRLSEAAYLRKSKQERRLAWIGYIPKNRQEHREVGRRACRRPEGEGRRAGGGLGMRELERVRDALWAVHDDYRAGDLSDDEVENRTNVLDSLADLARLSLQRSALEHAWFVHAREEATRRP